MSNFKYGASCTEVMYKKLEHPTDNLKDTRLFICRQAKNRQAKNKILFHACGSRLAARLAARGSTLYHLQVRTPLDCYDFWDSISKKMIIIIIIIFIIITLDRNNNYY